MIYECEHCEATLGPGMTACPRCGQLFDEPVPADALYAAPAAPAPPQAAPPPIALPPALSATPARRPGRLLKRALSLAGALALIGLVFLGLVWAGSRMRLPAVRSASAGITPTVSVNSLPTDLAAHPGYPANMAAFVHKLRATGVGAQWPAFGSNDTLVITPQTLVNGQRSEWNPDLYRALAQGVYANFVFQRYGAGFSDTDSTTCFVLVSDPSGQVVAADLMGNLK